MAKIYSIIAEGTGNYGKYKSLQAADRNDYIYLSSTTLKSLHQLSQILSVLPEVNHSLCLQVSDSFY